MKNKPGCEGANPQKHQVTSDAISTKHHLSVHTFTKLALFLHGAHKVMDCSTETGLEPL